MNDERTNNGDSTVSDVESFDSTSPMGSFESQRDSDQESTASPPPDMGKVRDLVLAAHPDVVPELVQGDSIDALLSSVDGARAAYQRIADAAAPIADATAPTEAAPPAVASQPGGERQTFVVDVESLSPSAKISEGLRRIKRD